MWHEGGHFYVEDLFRRYCLNENVVRGVVLTLFEQYKPARAWRRQGAQEILADFIYAQEISDILLAGYMGPRKYPDFASFFPVLLKRLQQRHPPGRAGAAGASN